MNLLANYDSSKPTIALINSSDLIDDLLKSLNVSFETFCDEFVGSWMFGYINALKQVGVRTILFCVSAHVDKPSYFLHKPTGATICVLPPTSIFRAYRGLEGLALKSYGASEGQSFKDIQDKNQFRSSLMTKFKDLFKSFGTYSYIPLHLFA